MMGVPHRFFFELASGLPNSPLGFGANCRTGAADLLRTLQGLAAHTLAQALISKGNARIPKYVNGHIHYDGTPELMADYAEMARDDGATIIGGCCGTMPEHLTAMRKTLETRPSANTPSHQDITEALRVFFLRRMI